MTTPETLASLGRAQLEPYLADRRWFGAKGREVVSITLRDVAPLPDTALFLACIRVRFADGDHTDHQLPLALRKTGDAAEVITTINGQQLVDATAEPEFRKFLGDAFARDLTVEVPDCRWRFTPLSDLTGLGDLPTKLVGAEQSNTSIIYGDRAILKIFRRLEPGVNPDVEVGRFLARTGFRGTPALLGVATLHASDGPCVAGMIQQLMPGATDGWAHVLARLRSGDDLSTEIAALGAVTRELHAALASATDDPDFIPETTRREDLDRWRDATLTQARTALQLLAERQPGLPAAILPDVLRVLEHAPSLLENSPAPDDVAGIGPRTRHHGDYHLGQVLHTADGWRIIDFEGEPARPLQERRAKLHPLRDVAGMLRSFAYAAAVGAPERAAAVEHGLRTAFLTGYDRTLLNTRDDPKRAALLALFTAEKLFYELAYELGSRPTWAWIPLAGITAMLPAEARR